MKFRNIAIGTLTTAMTTLGAPNMYALENNSSDGSSSKTPQKELLEKKNNLHVI